VFKRLRLSYSQVSTFVIFLTLATGLTGCDGATGAISADEQSALLVRVERAVLAKNYTIEREFIGRVEAARQARIGFELGGQLRTVHVQEGDSVAAGAILAQLDTARLTARLAEAQASLDQALSAARFADRSLERSEVAAEFEGISAQELDIAVDGANAARAGVAAARARLNSVQVDLDKSRLRAPFNATIISRQFDEGQIVAPGEPVLHVQESAAPEVRIGVAGDLSGRLQPGDEQSLLINGERIDAIVRAVLPLRDPATRTIDVILTLSGGAALPGDIARLPLEQAIDESGFWLPISALAEGSRGLWIAYVVMPLDAGRPSDSGATHYLQPRAVELLYEDTEQVYVRGALSDGDLYVTGGLTRVVPNQQVRVAARGIASEAAVNGS